MSRCSAILYESEAAHIGSNLRPLAVSLCLPIQTRRQNPQPTSSPPCLEKTQSQCGCKDSTLTRNAQHPRRHTYSKLKLLTSLVF